MYVINGRKFNSDRALINHAVWQVEQGIVKNVQEFAQLYLYPIRTTCKYCSEYTSLLTLTKGWGTVCDSESCSIQHTKDARISSNRHLANFDGSALFLAHFIENKEFYISSYNVSSNSLITMPFNNKQIRQKYIKLWAYNLMQTTHKDALLTHKICNICEKDFGVCVFANDNKTRTSCYSRPCVSFLKYNPGISRKEKVDADNNERHAKLLANCISGNFDGVPVLIYKFEGKRLILCEEIFKNSRLTEAAFITKALNLQCHVCTENNFTPKKAISIFTDIQAGVIKNIFCSTKCYNNCDHSVLYPYSEEKRKKQSATLKEKIRKGEFTPCVTNSWSKSRIVIHGIPFRSSWEAAYWLLNQHLEFEKLRIPYVNDQGISRNYIVDFVDHTNKIIYEVKPNSEKKEINNLLKEAAAMVFCKENGYTYVMINDEWFFDNVDEIISSAKPLDCGVLLTKRMSQFLKCSKR